MPENELNTWEAVKKALSDGNTIIDKDGESYTDEQLLRDAFLYEDIAMPCTIAKESK